MEWYFSPSEYVPWDGPSSFKFQVTISLVNDIINNID